MILFFLLIIGIAFILIIGVVMIEILIEKNENDKISDNIDKIEPKHKTITGALYRDRRNDKKNT